MPRFTDAGDLRRHIEEALAYELRLGVIQAQADLGSAAISPVDTGRFRSSWFASKGDRSTLMAPPGTNTPRNDAQQLRIAYNDEIHLTNSLPYARPVALGIQLPPSWGGVNRVKSKSPTWYKDFRDFRIPAILQAAGDTAKRRFQL